MYYFKTLWKNENTKKKKLSNISIRHGLIGYPIPERLLWLLFRCSSNEIDGTKMGLYVNVLLTSLIGQWLNLEGKALMDLYKLDFWALSIVYRLFTNGVDVSYSSHEDGKRSSFWNVVFF
jgi:hypothetical protein